jgi:hypothetical protein
VLWDRLQAEPLAAVDYAEAVDPETFRSPGSLAVLAVRIGKSSNKSSKKTRLIDNHDLTRPFPG